MVRNLFFFFLCLWSLLNIKKPSPPLFTYTGKHRHLLNVTSNMYQRLIKLTPHWRLDFLPLIDLLFFVGDGGGSNKRQQTRKRTPHLSILIHPSTSGFLSLCGQRQYVLKRSTILVNRAKSFVPCYQNLYG